jgi:hypothetical protein
VIDAYDLSRPIITGLSALLVADSAHSLHIPILAFTHHLFSTPDESTQTATTLDLLNRKIEDASMANIIFPVPGVYDFHKLNCASCFFL